VKSDLVLICVVIVVAGVGCMKNEGVDPVALPDGSPDDVADGVPDADDRDGAGEDAESNNDSQDSEDGPAPDSAPDVSWDADASLLDAAASSDGPVDGAEVTDVAPEAFPIELVNGQACRSDSWCHSRFCVDGVCCESACERDEPMRCKACSMARTGQRDGICAADRSKERAPCGAACGQVAMNVPSVLEMICVQGACLVPDAPRVVDTCRQELDRCTSSFCDQPTTRSARCVHSLCPQVGTCCCESPTDRSARSCVTTNACTTGRMCVSP
jgi:hypothetical protein